MVFVILLFLFVGYCGCVISSFCNKIEEKKELSKFIKKNNS